MLLDGFPRSQEQFDTLHSYLRRTGETCVGIVLDLPEHHARERMLARGRADDTPDAIQKRIAQYYASTKPILTLFGRHY
jgi:adenylate kinase